IGAGMCGPVHDLQGPVQRLVVIAGHLGDDEWGMFPSDDAVADPDHVCLLLSPSGAASCPGDPMSRTKTRQLASPRSSKPHRRNTARDGAFVGLTLASKTVTPSRLMAATPSSTSRRASPRPRAWRATE